MPTDFYRRFGPLICLAALLVWPVLLYGTKGAFESHTNNVADWLPETFDETQRLFWFVDRFGSDEILVMSWPGATLEDERLDRLAETLLEPLPTSDGESRVLFHRVFTGRQVYVELISEPLSLSPVEALRRMRGWLLGPDGETTCAVALVSRAGMDDRHAALEAAYAAAEAVGIDREKLKVGGSTADSVAIDDAGMRGIYVIAFFSALIGTVIAWWCLRQMRLVAAVLLTSSFAWSLSLSVVYFSGTNMDAVLLLMPALVFVLGVSGAVHMTNYYRTALEEDGLVQAPLGAIRRGWLPCALANVTTAIGLGSLAVSHVRPITRFGVFSAIGVLIVLATLLILWPSIVQLFTRQSKNSPSPPLPHSPTRHWWRPFYHLASSHYILILTAAAVILPACVYGVTKLTTSARLEDLLSEDSDLIQDYAWLQENIGPLVPVEVVLDFPAIEGEDREQHAQMAARLRLVEQLRKQIDGLPHAGGSIAATTFTRPIPEGGGFREVAERRIVVRETLEHLDRLIELRYIHQEGDRQLWRISSRIEALEGLDYGEYLHDLEAVVDGFLAEHREALPEVSRTIAGAVPLVYMAQEQMLSDMINSFSTAFVLVGVMMILLLRSPSGGLLAMAPNVFPAVVVFGTMGWLGRHVDIGTTMTASAALGIAIDDTLHFLVWYRRGLAGAATRLDAVRHAFEHAATPILQTSLICGLGLLAFATSSFEPTARFGWLIALLLLMAPLGELLLLPAILASPIGKAFGAVGSRQ